MSDEVSSIDTGKSKFDAKESGDYEILGSTGVIGYDDSFDYEGDFLLTARVGANAGTLYRHSGKLKITDNTVFLQGSHIDFAFYLLDKFDLKKMSFGSGQPLIKASELKCLELMMPVQNEEKEKIATYFLNLDNLITLHQRKYFIIYNKLITWEQRKLEQVAKYRNGKAHENEIDEDGDYIVVNSKFVSTDGEVKKYSASQIEPLFENEIAFVLSDVPNGRAIARTFLVDKSGKYTLNQRIAGITPLDNTCPYFLHILMNRNSYFLKFDDGVKQTNLSLKDVLSFEEYYPEYDEQKKIGDYFRNLDHLITLHRRAL